MANSNYKDKYEAIAAFQCNDVQLNKLKVHFSSQINSKRKQDQINNMSQLLKILEKRDYLNETNIDILKIIASLIGLPLANRPPAEEIPAVPSPLTLPVSEDAKVRAYSLMASEIGHKWHDFARALKIREGKIDELQLNRSYTARIYDILDFHDNNCDRRTWRTGLTDALLEIRRRDLHKEVQHIFDVY